MNHERICTWLGLPTGVWPPDHYRLLGISPGTADPAQIERHVFERMETVRRYQLQDPELATEAMNRLAQAFVCLTNPEAKKTYDAQMLVPPPRRRVSSASGAVIPSLPPDPQLEEISDLPVGDTADPLAWMYGGDNAAAESPVAEPGEAAEEPHPVTPETPTTIIEALDTLTELTSLPPKNGSAAEAPASAFADIAEEATAPPDPIVEAARSSEAAIRGISTKRGLYHRIAKTRRLIHAWDEAGAYLGNPERRLAKPVEATELIFLLGTIRSLLKGFPPLLGKAGQPGYLVVALAKQQVIVPTYQTLLPSQRESLARDWDAGQKLLQAHRDFLRVELRIMRRRSLPARMVRVVRHFVAAHPGMVLLALGLLIFGITLWRVVYLGAMTGNSGPVSFSKKKDPEPASSSPSRPVNRQDTHPKAEEVKKSAPVPEPKVPDKEKTPEVAKDLEVPTPEVKTTEAVQEPEKEDKLRRLTEPFGGGDPKASAVRGLTFVSDKDATDPQFYSCDWYFVTHWGLLEDATDGEKTRQNKFDQKKFDDQINALAVFSKTGAIALGSEDGTIYFCGKDERLADAKRLEKMKHNGQVKSLVFSPLGLYLASAGEDGWIHVLHIDFDKPEPPKNLSSEPKSLTFLGDRLLVSGHADGSLAFWRLDSKIPVQLVQHAHEGKVSCLIRSPDGTEIASSGSDGAIHLWRLLNVPGFATCIVRTKSIAAASLDKRVTCLAYSISGRYLLASFENKSIVIFDTRTGKEELRDDRWNDQVTAAVFSPDGKGLLLGHGDGSIVFYALPKHLAAKSNPAK